MAKKASQTNPTESRAPHPFQVTPFEAAKAMHDKAVLLMDAKWGTDVVETLVDPETAARFARAKAKMNAAIEAGDDEAAIAAFGNVVRGLAKLDEMATAAGHVPLKPDRSWATRDEEGNPWVFVQDEDAARAAARSGRFKGYQIWSLPEVMRVLKDRSFEAVLKAKGMWPEAAVAEVKPPVDWRKGDEVPF